MSWNDFWLQNKDTSFEDNSIILKTKLGTVTIREENNTLVVNAADATLLIQLHSSNQFMIRVNKEI